MLPLGGTKAKVYLYISHWVIELKKWRKNHYIELYFFLFQRNYLKIKNIHKVICTYATYIIHIGKTYIQGYFTGLQHIIQHTVYRCIGIQPSRVVGSYLKLGGQVMIWGTQSAPSDLLKPGWGFSRPSHPSFTPLAHNDSSLQLSNILESTERTIKLYIMAVEVVEFSNGGYKIRNIFAEESTEYRLKRNYWILRIGLIERCRKVPKFDFQSQFSMSKIFRIFLIFFSLKNIN